jgi:hypothetical protein
VFLRNEPTEQPLAWDRGQLDDLLREGSPRHDARDGTGASIAEGLVQNMPRETDGALHGGITTFAHFVGQRNEPLVPNIDTTMREGNRWSRTDYFFHAIVSTDSHYAELPAMWDRGVTSFKNAYKPRPTEGLSTKWPPIRTPGGSAGSPRSTRCCGCCPARPAVCCSTASGPDPEGAVTFCAVGVT